jgi:3-oxoacyl-[acyl-carrier protein] reductase
MDRFLQLGRDPLMRRLMASIGQPITFPPALRRASGPLSARILKDAAVAVGALAPAAARDGRPASDVTATMASALARLGARVEWHGDPAARGAFQASGEAWGEPVVNGADAAPEARLTAAILDASRGSGRQDLDALYEFLHATVPRLTNNGRVILIVSADVDETAVEPHLAAFRQAVEGVTRSLAKELGRKGVTCNLLRVETGAHARLVPALRFLLSERAAFITGQPLRVSGMVTSVASLEFQPEPLRGKVALVTGAARGIGEATARVLSREGAHVVVLDHPSAADAGSALARTLGGTFLGSDLATPEAPAAVVRFLEQHFGRVNVVIHNAGITRDKTLARMPKESWDAVLSVNLEAILRLNDLLIPSSVLADDARMVLLSSVGGIAGNPGQTNYAAAKAGLIGYLRALAPRLATRGITVNAVAPGLIETQMTARMPTFVREAARRLSALNQGGLPVDVAEAILFLSLPDSYGVSGAVLRVCGGALVGA